MTGRTQHVIANNEMSYPAEVRFGMPQGSGLGLLIFILSIESINNNNIEGDLGLFTDDTCEGLAIRSASDAMKVQDDLAKLGEWSDDINIAFNNLKFECLQIGYNENLKTEYNYMTPNLDYIIEVKDNVKDLGVWMSFSGNFDFHITKTITKVKQRIGWIQHSFKNNDIEFRKFLWKNYIAGVLDYNSQIWSPVNDTKISSIEQPLRSYTYQTKGLENYNYWDRHKIMGISSLQQRFQRYKIIYI